MDIDTENIVKIYNEIVPSLWEILTILVIYILVQNSSFFLVVIPASVIMYAGHVYLEEQVKDTIEDGNDNNQITDDDEDDFDWINDISKVLWLQHRQLAEDIFRQDIWPIVLRDCCKTFRSYFNKITLEEFYIGDTPIEIIDVQVWNGNDDDIILDLEIKYEGNAIVTMKFDGGAAHGIFMAIPVTVQDICIQSAKMRLVLKNVNHQLPFVSSLHFSFVEPPKFRWTITNWSELASIPCMAQMTMDFAQSKLIDRLILPRTLILPVEMPTFDMFGDLNSHFSFKTNVFNCIKIIRKPVQIVTITVLKSDLEINHFNGFISVKYDGHNFNQKFTSEPKYYKFHLPVEYVNQKHQNLQIALLNSHKGIVGQINVNLTKILATRASQHWYGLEGMDSRLKIRFEVSNELKTNGKVSTTKPFGILSLFLKNFVGAKDQVYKPIVHVSLDQTGVEASWKSLPPFSSRPEHNLNEGVFLTIFDVTDKKSQIHFKIFDVKHEKWIGQERILHICDFLGSRPFQETELKVEKNVTLTLVATLFHL